MITKFDKYNESVSELTDTRYEELTKFVSTTRGCHTYLHTTRTKEACENIINNGFRFEDFPKTTDYLNDLRFIGYLMSTRKPYGVYVVIIQIPAIIDNIEKLCSKSVDEEGFPIFILPSKYIKCYYNRETKELVKNPLFSV